MKLDQRYFQLNTQIGTNLAKMCFSKSKETQEHYEEEIRKGYQKLSKHIQNKGEIS